MLLYVANWPKQRINAWDSLLKARAIENMSYTIGVNRVGTIIIFLEYNGHLQIIDFSGNYLIEPQTDEEIYSTNITQKKFVEFREKFGFLNDRDTFKVLD